MEADTSRGNAELRARAVRGAVWSFVRNGGVQALRLLGNLILTRILFAEAFGLLALVAVFMSALEMFSDIGIQPSIVRSARGDEQTFLDTAWTIQVMRGFALWVCACLLAVPMASFYEEPRLVWLIPTIGVMAVINGFASTKQLTLNRHLYLGRLVVLEIGAQIVGLVFTVGFALVYRSIWPLIAGAIIASLVRTLLTITALPGTNNRFHWDRSAVTELFQFGRWIFLSTLLTFTSQSADRLIFGKMVSLEMLGIYSIGRMMAGVPSEALGHIGQQVVFPIYSRLTAQGKDLKEVFTRVRRPLLVGAGYILSILIAGGSAIIDVLYDPRYAAAGWVVQLLSLAAWFQILETTNGGALLSMGKPKWLAAGTGAKTLAIIVLIPIGSMNWGFPGAVAALAVAELAKYAVSCWAVSRQNLPTLAQDLPLSAVVLTSGAVAFWLTRLWPLHALLQLVLITIVVTAIWLPALLPMLRSLRLRSAMTL